MPERHALHICSLMWHNVTRPINGIVLHGSYTPPTMDIGTEVINDWHKAKGYDQIGYHYVVRRDNPNISNYWNMIETGRPLEKKGAHCIPVNETTIGICLIGGKSMYNNEWDYNYSSRQEFALANFINFLCSYFPIQYCLGHRELQTNRACPGTTFPFEFDNRPDKTEIQEV